MKYICTGRVQPERANVGFSRTEMQLPCGGTAIASCDASQLTVVLQEPNLDGWISAQMMAEDVAGIIVGSLGFSLGCGYSVEVIQVTEEDGTPHVFGVQPKSAEETLGLAPQMAVLNRALQLSGKDVFFRLAVRDYLAAMTDWTDCATYCYRAIESIQSGFAFKSGKTRWDDMHLAFGTQKELIETTVKQYADPVRHGNWATAKGTTGAQRWDMLILTKIMLVKYLEFAEPEHAPQT
jgi:hypothetical protein